VALPLRATPSPDEGEATKRDETPKRRNDKTVRHDDATNHALSMCRHVGIPLSRFIVWAFRPLFDPFHFYLPVKLPLRLAKGGREAMG